MKNFRTFEAAVEFYRAAIVLRVHGTLREQLLRASASIPLNLAEGRGKSTLKDQVKFFTIAMGSVRECQAILILGNLEGTRAWDLLDKLAAKLYRLIERARG